MDVKFSCPQCGQLIDAAEEMAGDPSECPTCSQPFVVPLTLGRANHIVDLVEAVLISGHYVANSFTRLSTVGASNRLEVVHALYLVTAQFFQQCRRQTTRPDAESLFDEFARAAGVTAFRVVTTFLPDAELDYISTLPNRRGGDPSDQQYLRDVLAFTKESQRLTKLAMNDALFKQTETLNSFVSFLRTLDPTRSDYWPEVYHRMGVPYPIEPDVPRVLRALSDIYKLPFL